MKAIILDLRYRMKDVLKALERREKVSIFYHGKLKGVITPCTGHTAAEVTKHPFFNMRKTAKTVEEEMHELRGGRYRAV